MTVQRQSRWHGGHRSATLSMRSTVRALWALATLTENGADCDSAPACDGKRTRPPIFGSDLAALGHLLGTMSRTPARGAGSLFEI
jgi:hypothetical protein